MTPPFMLEYIGKGPANIIALDISNIAGQINSLRSALSSRYLSHHNKIIIPMSTRKDRIWNMKVRKHNMIRGPRYFLLDKYV